MVNQKKVIDVECDDECQCVRIYEKMAYASTVRTVLNAENYFREDKDDT